MKKNLVACDGSPSSERAVAAAAELAMVAGGKLFLIAVGELMSGRGMQNFAGVEKAVADVIEAETYETISRARSIAETHGLSDIATKSVCGDPAQAILDEANAIDADVIVVGKRGRGQLAGLLLGSVSQKLAALAHCAVLIVP